MPNDNSNLTFHTPIRSVLACFCAALLTGSPVNAQSVVLCQPTAPFSNPQFADGKSGWSPTTSALTAANLFAVGDVTGDGNDEIVSVIAADNQYSPISADSILVSRWIQSGWSPMYPISNTMLQANSGLAAATLTDGLVTSGDLVPLGVSKITLADVDGDGRKDIVAFACWVSNATKPPVVHCQEQIYSYATGAPALLTAYDVSYEQPSLWFKAHSSDKQYSRFNFDPNGSLTPDIKQLVNGTWTSLPGDGVALTTPPSPTLGNCVHQLYCMALSDVDGDGIADLVFLGEGRGPDIFHEYASGVFVVLSTPQAFFAGGVKTSQTVSSLDQALPNSNVNNPFDQSILDSWQMGDIDGDGHDEMIFATPDGSLNAYYYDPASNDFAAVLDPRNTLTGYSSTYKAINSTYTTMILVGNGYGVASIGQGSSNFILFQISNGAHIAVANVPLTSAISTNSGFGPSGYAGYFRTPLENGKEILIARSATGIVLTDQNMMDPAKSLDRGYPAYSTGQQLAYAYISSQASGNPDIRSLYTDPAVPWPYLQSQVEALASPPASSGIAAADFQYVQKQTTDEITAVETANALYGITGQVLTNTYLVKDAALQEVTQALGLPADPDVGNQVLTGLTATLGTLGSALSSVYGIISIVNDAKEVATIVNTLTVASNFAYVLGAITGDVPAYSPSSAPDSTTGTYDLKTALDNQDLGVATSNSCHQQAAVSNWNQSKFISDGILTGILPLDVNTQQAFLQTGQAAFRLAVWQSLTPTKWTTLSVLEAPIPPAPPCNNCLFTGNKSYPLAYSVQATATCSGNPKTLSLVMEDPNTHNYMSLQGLDALFQNPPNGIGAHPSDVLLGNNGWNIPYTGSDVDFGFNNLTDGNQALFIWNCSNFKPLAGQITPNIREGGATAVKDSPRRVRPSVVSAGPRLAALTADVKKMLLDARFRDRMLLFLDAAAMRLKVDQQYGREPKETLRLLNQFIAQSQYHAGQEVSDGAIARAESIEAVSIRDSIISSMDVPAAN